MSLFSLAGLRQPLHRFEHIMGGGKCMFVFLTIMFFLLTNAALNAQHGRPCCDLLPSGVNDVVLNDGSQITAPTTYANQVIYVIGSVSFDANVTMTRCTLVMCENAFLNVNNSLLTLQDDLAGNQTVVTGCTSKWNRININQGASLKAINCIIRDGINGLSFNTGFNNGPCQIMGCLFAGNDIAIRSDNTTNFTFQTFNDNTFTAVRHFVAGIPQNSVVPLPPIGNSKMGIRLTNVSGSVGTGPAGLQNVFLGEDYGPGFNEGLSSGIWAHDANLHVQNCSFSDIDGGGAVGILAVRSILVIEKLYSNGASCEFIRNDIGVRSDFGHNEIFSSHVGVQYCCGGTRYVDQDYRMNVWDGSFTGATGNHPNFNINEPGGSWRVDPTGPGYDPEAFPNPSTPTNW